MQFCILNYFISFYAIQIININAQIIFFMYWFEKVFSIDKTYFIIIRIIIYK